MTDLEKIKMESESALKAGSAEEISDLIFDTLFGNKQFPQFDENKLTPINDFEDTQEVDRGKKTIRFGYCGHIYIMQIEMEG